MPNSARTRVPEMQDIILLLIAAVTLYFSLFKFPYYPYFFEGDSLLFLTAADRMLHGEYLYRDFFEITFPGTHVLYASLFLVFGIKYWIVGLAVLAAGISYFWITLRISRILIDGSLAVIPSVLVVFFGFRFFSLDGSHRIFSPIPVLLAVWILLKQTSPGYIAAAGAFCALAAFFTQQRGVLAIAAITIFLFLHNRFTGGTWRRFLLDSSILTSAFLITLAALLGYFIATAGPEVFVNSTFIYPAKYYSTDPQNNFGALYSSLSDIYASDTSSLRSWFLSALFHSLVPACAFAIFAIVAIKQRLDKNWERWQGVTLVALVGAFLYFGTTGPHVLRLFNVSAPALIVAIWLLHQFDFFRRRQTILAVTLSFFLIAMSARHVIQIQSRDTELEIDSPRGKVFAPRSPQVVRFAWLVEHTQPGDYAFEAWPGYIYFLPGLRNPSPYGPILPTDYTRPEWVMGTVNNLKTKPTRYVLWDNAYNKLDSLRDVGDHTAPLSEYIRSEYDSTGPEYTFGTREFQIWEKRSFKNERNDSK